MSDRKYRFFFHYRKQTRKLTLHYKNKCIGVDDIECKVPCESKWNKGQPHLIMRGFSSSVKYEDNEGKIKAIVE